MHTSWPQNKHPPDYPHRKQMSSGQCQQATKTTTQQPLQPQPSTMQSPHTTQTGQPMDQQDYNNKAQALQDTNTYRVLNKDPTPQLKNKLITLLKNIKQSGGLSTQKYKQLYPTSAVPPKFYGLHKIHKTGTPLRPIVSSRGSITYGVAKELSHIIKPLVGPITPAPQKHPTLHTTTPRQKVGNRGNHHLI